MTKSGILERIHCAITSKRTAEIIRAELADQRALEARLPAIIAEATREHREAMEEFDAERGRPAMIRKREGEKQQNDARQAITHLEAELTEVEAREAEAARRKHYETVAARTKATRERFITRYPELAGAIATLMRDVAEADLAIAAANEDLPTDAKPIRTIANEIWTSAEPRVDLRDEPFEAWIRRMDQHLGPNASPIPDDLARTLIERDGKTLAVMSTTEFEVVKVRGVRRHYLPPVTRWDGLASRLCLPGLAHHHDHFTPALKDDALSVLGVLERHDMAASTVDPGRQPTFEILTPEQARNKPLRT